GLSTAGGAPAGSFGATSAGSNNAILPVAAGAIAIGALAAASHGGGSAPIITPPPSPSPTVAPTATPAPAYGPVVLTPSFVALTVGQSKTVTASQSGNTTNTFTVGAPVVCPGTGNGTVVQTAPGTFQVTSTATSSGRTCTVQVNGLGGQFTTLGMTL
ncbi:MAG: hypothetical protein JO359_11185, partial [Candidatus Eremiobacteraeota bacterium]|nr:hypothetical protein [Candidatus Eremiobacteraeota bacterium]